MNKEDVSRWTRSLLIALVLFLIFSVYLFIRRGYFNLYIANKVFGSTAAILAGIALVIGPLSKHFTYFLRFMTIRRHMGLLAFAFAIMHALISVFFIPNKFSITWYTKEWLPVTFGILTVGTWMYMTFISRNSKIKELGADAWGKRLSIAGQLAFAFIFLHLTIMKTNGWIKWFNGEVKQTPELLNPSYPPASIFVLLTISLVILYRIYVFLARKPISSQDVSPAPQPVDVLKTN